MSSDIGFAERWNRIDPGPHLETRLRLLGSAMAATVLGRFVELAWLLQRAREQAIPRRELEELLLQTCLFAGYPRTLNAFDAHARVFSGEPAPPPPPDDAADPDRGRRLFERIYGQSADRVLERLGERHPELPIWILRDAYGRVLSRPGLDPIARELAAVAALAVTRLPEQLRSHARGALRLGASPEAVREMIRTVGIFGCEQEVAEAIGACAEVLAPPK